MKKFRTPVTQIILNHALKKLYITIPDTVVALKTKKITGNLEQAARNNIKKLVLENILKKTKNKIGRADIYVHSKLQKMLMNQ